MLSVYSLLPEDRGYVPRMPEFCPQVYHRYLQASIRSGRSAVGIRESEKSIEIVIIIKMGFFLVI